MTKLDRFSLQEGLCYDFMRWWWPSKLFKLKTMVDSEKTTKLGWIVTRTVSEDLKTLNSHSKYLVARLASSRQSLDRERRAEYSMVSNVCHDFTISLHYRGHDC